MVPHPPIIVPAVGRGEERKIEKTTEAFRRASAFIAEKKPDRVIIISPHATAYADYMHISPGERATGSLAQFGAPEASFSVNYDKAFTEALSAACAQAGLSAGTQGERESRLDHATLVPLYFLSEAMKSSDAKFVRIGLSGLSLQEHYRLGMLIKETAEKAGGTTVIIASGDLSHRLREDGPYGFNPEGPKYDAAIMKAMGSGSFGELFDFTEESCEEAGECGHRSFVIMAGAFDGEKVKSELLSYEGPFGVGYGVCTFTPEGADDSRHFLEQYEEKEASRVKALRRAEDPFVKLARASMNSFIREGKVLPLPEGLPAELTERRAGVFVSLKKDGRLRGCIGTTAPTQPSVAYEIIRNAISASTEDPRFDAVRPEELEKLTCTVDVLGPAEPVASADELDVKRYGVIVSKGNRRGLLLPDLAGVDTPKQQIDIARQKAGIRPEEKVNLERFEVVRHF